MTPDPGADKLVDTLLAQEALDTRWAQTFRAVPRESFVPETVYRWEPDRDGNDLVPLHRSDDPEAWLDLVRSDRPVTTQVDDGHPAPDGCGYESTSSCSQPSVVADMLATLDPQRGERILEIGTGTGWNAALLAHAVGAQGVTTIEVDTVVAARARETLDRTGWSEVTTVVGDGSTGHPGRAPYDRLIATVGVQEVPRPWVDQVVPGGRIVVPLTGMYWSPGIAVLIRRADGTAAGRLAGPATFMGLRGQRHDRGRAVARSEAEPVRSTTTVHPHHVVGDRAAAVAIGLQLTGVSFAWQRDGDLGTLHLYASAERSWATVELRPDPPYPVEQEGPRALWTEVQDAHHRWIEHGRPAVGDWFVTVDADGQRIELRPER